MLSAGLGKGCRPCLGLMFVRRKIASLFAGFADIRRTRGRKCGAGWVCAFDKWGGFGAFAFFRQPRILGCWVCLGLCWEWLGLFCDLPTPGGFSPPSTPRQRLARRCTPRFLISRLISVHSFTFAPRLFLDTNNVGTWLSKFPKLEVRS